MLTGRGNTGACARTERSRPLRLFLRALLIALCLNSFPLIAQESEPAVSKDDEKCLKCHSRQLKKKLEDGEKMSLHVAVGDLGNSVHAAIPCVACHQDIPNRKHPREKVVISTQRDYSVEMNKTCGNCHSEMTKQYEGSIHASLVASGDKAAPVCTDCHSAHKVEAATLFEPVKGQACQACHEPIFEAFSQSVHGRAAAEGNMIRPTNIKAPVCADCHRAHDTQAVAAGNLIQSTCLSCHEDASRAHEAWLPNAGHHLKMVSCAACHSPMAERSVDLQLVDRETNTAVGKDSKHSTFETRLAEIDESDEILSSSDLRKLIRQQDTNGDATKMFVRGRMEVKNPADAHRLEVKASATRDCESCHKKNSGAFDNVTVSVERPDGRRQRFEADGDLLTSAGSMDTVGGFYVIGGTRINILDALLVLALLGGLAIPIGHIVLGKILNRNT